MAPRLTGSYHPRSCTGKNFSAFGAECKPCPAGSEADGGHTHCLPCGHGLGGLGCMVTIGLGRIVAVYYFSISSTSHRNR